MTDSLAQLLEQSAALHRHLCPRQVLGVRMGMLAGKVLGLELPQSKKRLLTIVETDGCFADGVSVATNCWVGRRTLRVVDFGKVAATFIDTHTETAVRLFPLPHIRDLASVYAGEARSHWEAYLFGYQQMPDDLMFAIQPVTLNTPIAQIISHARARVICSHCGEEIVNQREAVLDGIILCQSCVGQGYCKRSGDSGCQSPESTIANAPNSNMIASMDTSQPPGGISPEEWAITPTSVQGLVYGLLVTVQLLEKRAADLEEQLGRNSSNFSKPPSSDPPGRVTGNATASAIGSQSRRAARACWAKPQAKAAGGSQPLR